MYKTAAIYEKCWDIPLSQCSEKWKTDLKYGAMNVVGAGLLRSKVHCERVENPAR